MAAKDMVGSRFGALSVLSRAGSMKDGTATWRCICDCGEERVIAGTSIRAGRNKSCGCMSPKFTTESVRTHGLSRSRTYSIWAGMVSRCSPSATGKDARLYYDKGIRVCKKWERFEGFFEDMGIAPDSMTLDRIDGNLGYSRDNCRWASYEQQANNQSLNRYITYLGESKTIAQWARQIGIKPNTLLYRIRRGVPADEALRPRYLQKRSVEKLDRQRCCQTCGESFIPRPSQIKSGAGKFCSRQCIQR